MVHSNKKLSAQKYFVFKLFEYFKNSYGVLQNKRYDSLIAMFEEIVDIQNEINKSKVDTSPLQKSLDNLIDSFVFQWSGHPLIKHSRINKDLNCILSKMKIEKNIDNSYYITLYNSITSILKKINKQDIVKLYLDVLKEETLSYGEIDKLLDSFVSELLFQGYSLRYLEEWYLKEIHPIIKDEYFDQSKLDIALTIISDLACNDNTFYVIFSCKLPRDLQKEIYEQKGIRIKNLFVSDGCRIINDLKEKIKIDEKQLYLYTEAITCDKYKAVEVIKSSIESYAEIYKMLTQSSRTIINDKTIFYISSDKENWEKVILEDIIYINNKMVSINKREKEDIQDLILLRRSINNTGEACPHISIIERTLEITKNALELSSGNKLLNIWSGLEYLSTFYYKDKIIERARSIIPRVICLYYLKNKLNILWDRIQHYKYRENLEVVKSCITICCKNNNPLEYDIQKFALFLSDIEKAKSLYEEFSQNIIIQREIAELNALLQNKESITLNVVKDLNEMIKHDLNRIYRIRNKLVHSGSNIPENIDIFTFRLYKYVNSLLSILIYHIKRNPRLTITEVLYSVVETYSWYLDFVTKTDKSKIEQNIKDLVSPQYLYL